MGHVETVVDGIWYPSATTIIHAEENPWVTKWREKWGPLADKKTEMANKIGTEFHRCVELYLKGYAITMSDDVSPSMQNRIYGMLRSFYRWADSVNGDIHHTELKVLSRKHYYSGTLDAVGTFDGEPMLYDWKTSSRIYDNMDLQLVAYAQAYKEQTGIELKQGMIVCVSKDKPDFKLTTKVFKLGKRQLNKFLRLRAKFDDAARLEILNAKTTVAEASSSKAVEDTYQSEPEGC